MSIYLLKLGYNSSNSLIEKHGLDQVTDADALPKQSELWTAGIHTSTPWWQGYFGLPNPKKSANLGAILFLSTDERIFALTFGQTASRLRDDAYEYDFGLRVSLNAVDPEKLKSTDTSEPGAGRRQRTQTGADSALTFFDFDSDSAVMKSVTGKARKEYEDIVRQVTGATNLRIGTSVRSDELSTLCSQLLSLYASSAYETTFPGVGNLQPVRDPQLVAQLDGEIDLFSEAANPFLMIPEVMEYNEELYFRFVGAGSSQLFGDLDIAHLRSHLKANDVPRLTVPDMRRLRVLVTDGNGATRKSYSLYRCLNIERTSNDGIVHVLHDGEWFRARQAFVDEMRAAVAGAFRLTSLANFDDARESDYNERVSDGVSFINLDTTNVAGRGRTQLEPADLLHVDNDVVNLFHVKVSTRSSELSHLFNQGLNSAELLLSEEAARRRLSVLADEKSHSGSANIDRLLEESRIAVRYVIATRQDRSSGQVSLPFFSQITLWRAIRSFKMIRIEMSVELIANARPRKSSKAKERKERSDKGKKRTPSS